MSSIFGDTDDITFGSSSGSLPVPSREKPVSGAPRPPLPRRREEQAPPRQSFAPRPRTDTPRRPSSLTLPAAPSLSTSLRTLVDSMKPSFLPGLSEGILRLVILSEKGHRDPLMLVRSDDVTLVFGTGYASIENAGITYATLPDMRLITSEQDRLAGWVLTKTDFDIRSFMMVLEMLAFPFVYATRDVIAYIRNNISDATFIEKCRFFEIFGEGMTERKIAHLTLRPTSEGLTIEASGKILIDALHAQIDTPLVPSRGGVSLSQESTSYMLGSETCKSGEILDIVSGSKVSRQTLQFTFDRFYIDGSSIGVVAGYALKDRVDLAGSGVLTFVLEEDIRMRAIVGHIFIDSRGFVHSHEMMAVHKEVLKAIRHIYESTLLANPKVERGDLVSTLRRELTKYCYLLTGRTPVVMPVIIER